MKRALATISLLIGITGLSFGQINFSEYASYGLKVNNTPNPLNFGSVVANGSTYSIDAYDTPTIVDILGVKYLDVFISVSADNQLSCTNCDNASNIDFTLKGAYRNTKDDAQAASAAPLKYINNISNNSFTIRVPMLERHGPPPNTPPPPPTQNTDLTLDESNDLYEKLYLYIYGDIFVPESAAAGDYSGTITVTISYD